MPIDSFRFTDFGFGRKAVFNSDNVFKPTDYFVDQKHFIEAVRLASPTFYEEYCRQKSLGLLTNATKNTLLKYKIRACMRPVPFGLFSGIFEVEWGRYFHHNVDEQIVVGQNEINHNENENIYFLNPTIQKVGKVIRYIEQDNDTKKYHYSESSFWQFLKYFKIGETYTNNEISYSLTNLGLDFDEASALSKTLIENNVFLKSPQIKSTLLSLEQYLQNLTLDYSLPQKHFNLYINTSPPSLIPISKQSKILKVFLFLSYLWKDSKSASLSKFKDFYLEKYSLSDRPLLQVLDEQTGYIYKSEKVQFNQKSDLHSDINTAFLEAQLSGLHVLDIQHIYNAYKEQIEQYMPKVLSTNALVRFIDNRTTYIEGFLGNTAINNLGRFAFDNPNILQKLKHISNDEQKLQSDVILAEIRHSEDEQSIFLNQNVSLRYYNIPIFSGGLSSTIAIGLSDLMVSVRNNEVVLISKKHNKRVIPLLSDQFNYQLSSLPIYQFLCDLAGQNSIPFLSFYWGKISENQYFTPRVSLENYILKPATWYVPSALIKNAQNFVELAQLLKTTKLPLTFFVLSGEQQIFIDSSNSQYYPLLQSFANDVSVVQIQEYLGPQLVSKDKRISEFETQYVLPIVNHKYRYKPCKLLKKPKLPTQYTFGSEWLYVKLYCSENQADVLLLTILWPFIKKQLKSKSVINWYFLRYNDPDYHIRLRIKLTNFSTASAIFRALYVYNKKHSNCFERFVIDTYIPEYPKYGIDFLPISEELFQLQSELILSQKSIIAKYNLQLSDFELVLINIFLFIEVCKPTFQEYSNLISNWDIKEIVISKYGKSKLIEFNKDFREFNFSLIFDFTNKYFKKDSSKYLIKSQIRILKLYKTLHCDEFKELFYNHLHMITNRVEPNINQMIEIKAYYYLSKLYKSKLI